MRRKIALAAVPAVIAVLISAPVTAFANDVPHGAEGSGVFKVLELERNHHGAYALFSGGTLQGVRMKTEMCVLKAGSGKNQERLFCAPVVNVRSRVGAFYIPVEFETDVAMGSVVVFKDQPVPQQNDAEPEEKEPEKSANSTPWFPGGQKFDAGYMLQLTPAISTNSVSFAALPRETTNDPFVTRDPLNIALLGARFSWGIAFLKPDTYLGVGLSWATTSAIKYDNDYDLTDVNSHVESATSVSHLGISLLYGIDRNMTDIIGWRATAGLGMRQATVAAKADLKGTESGTIADAKIVATAPVVEVSTGGRYTFYGIDFTGDLLLAVPTGVTSTITGTFNTTQDVVPDDIKASVLKAVDPTKGLEMGLVLGARMKL